MDEFYVSVGKISRPQMLKIVRVVHEMTVSEMAEMAGVSQSTVSRYEAGELISSGLAPIYYRMLDGMISAKKFNGPRIKLDAADLDDFGYIAGDLNDLLDYVCYGNSLRAETDDGRDLYDRNQRLLEAAWNG